MSDDDEVAMPRRRRAKRRALRVPVDDVPRRSAVSELPPATLEATEAGEAVLRPDATQPSIPLEPASEPPPASDSVPPETLRSSYPPPPPGADVVMSGSVKVTSPGDVLAEMPDADVDSAPIAAEATQILGDDDLEYEEGDSVEVRIDELESDEADAVVRAAIESGAVPPPSGLQEQPEPGTAGEEDVAREEPSESDEEPSTDTVPGVSLEELAAVAEDVGVTDDPTDDEPELTVGESDELELDAELEELEDEEDGDYDSEVEELGDDEDDEDLEELDDEALEEAADTPPKPPVSGPGKAPPAPPEAAKPREAPKAPPTLPEEPKKKRRKPWFEGFFSDDYLRTVRPPTPREVSRECDFILGQLGLPRGSTILDVGCGLGLHAIELTRRGYLVVGLDLSLPMLSRAGDEAQDEGLRINFLHGDMRQMTFEGQFDAVLCWGTTFGYFDDEGNREVVQRLLEALKPKGLLLLDIVNRDHVIRDQPNLIWFEGDGCVCMEESRFDYLRSRLHVKRTVILDDGRQRENTYSLRLYSPHEIGKILHQKGFRVTKLSGMKATPGVFFGATSPELIILAERRAESAPPTSTMGRTTAKMPAAPDEASASAETAPGTEAAAKSEPPPPPKSEPPDPPADEERSDPPPAPTPEPSEPPAPDED